MPNTPTALAFVQQQLDDARKEIANLQQQLAEAQRVRDGYLENATNLVQQCGACAEIICCGSTMHQHRGCAIAQLAEAKAEVEDARMARSTADHLRSQLDAVTQELAEVKVKWPREYEKQNEVLTAERDSLQLQLADTRSILRAILIQRGAYGLFWEELKLRRKGTPWGDVTEAALKILETPIN